MIKKDRLIGQEDGTCVIRWYVRTKENGKPKTEWLERKLPSRDEAIREALDLGIVQVIAESGGLKNLQKEPHTEKGA